MLKKDWKKNLLRVKQIADQNLGRAEKSEVLSEDLQHLEKRVDLIKHACTNTHKKLCLCMQVTSSDEKKKKKYTESAIGSTMLESSSQLGHETLIGAMFKLGGDAATTQAFELVQHEQDLETNVLNPLQHLLENEIPAIQKLRKHLVKLTLDMDAAKTRYHSALKQAQNNNAHQPLKLDNIKDEMDDAQQKMEQCRDLLATEMYSFIAREPEFSRLLLKITQAQAAYHRKSLDLLESLVPQMEENFERNQQTPLFGGNLEDHLQRTNREIALVIEACITTLHAIGLEEEGLFRIAGAASKVKKLKAAFDSGMVDMAEYINDIHAVSSVLKHYLRELKEPLLTYDLYNDWMHAVQRPPEQRLQALWVVLNRVPKGHYNNIKYVIKFCARLATNQETNKMSPSNIAIVLGPNFIWPQGDPGPSVLSTSMQSAIVEQLITNHNYFFPGDIDYKEGKELYTSPHSVISPTQQPVQPHPPNRRSKIFSRHTVHHGERPNSHHGEKLSNLHSHPGEKPTSPGQGGLYGAHNTSCNQLKEPEKSPPPSIAMSTPPSIAKSSPHIGRSNDTTPNNSFDSIKRSHSNRDSLHMRPGTINDVDSYQTPYRATVSDCESLCSKLSYELETNRADAASMNGSHSNVVVHAPPAQKHPPPKDVHSDMYNTAFALHSLNSIHVGYPQSRPSSDYLSRVRNLWDGHLSSNEESVEGDVRPSDTETENTNGVVTSTEIDYSCATSSASTMPPYDVSDSSASHLSQSEPATHETYTPLPAQVNNVQPYPGTSQLQANHKANHDNNSISPSPKAPRRNPKKNVAPLPPPGTSNTEPQHAAPSSRAEKARSSIERPTQQPPAVPGKPSVVIPTHERAGSTGSDRPTASPPIKPEKPSVPTKPSHDRKPSGSGATLDRKSSSGTGPTHDRKPSYGTGTPHDKKPSSATSAGTPPVFPDVPRSPRMKPPDRPPQPTKTTTDPQSRGGSLERGLKPELPPHPSQVALDRQQRAGSGRPPRPPSPHQDRKKSVKSGASVDSKSDGIPPLADPEEDEEPIREETRL